MSFDLEMVFATVFFSRVVLLIIVQVTIMWFDNHRWLSDFFSSIQRIELKSRKKDLKTKPKIKPPEKVDWSKFEFDISGPTTL